MFPALHLDFNACYHKSVYIQAALYSITIDTIVCIVNVPTRSNWPHFSNRPSTTPGQGSGTREALLGEGDPDAYNVSFMDKLKKNYKVHSSRIRDRIINTYGEDAQTAEDQEALRRIEEGSEGTTFTDNAVWHVSKGVHRTCTCCGVCVCVIPSTACLPVYTFLSCGSCWRVEQRWWCT